LTLEFKLYCAVNVLCKIADDKSILVPEKTDICLEDEFEHKMYWSAQNNFKLILAKTKETVFHQPSPYNFVDPPLLDNIEEVILPSNLLECCYLIPCQWAMHVNHILCVVNQRFFH
jgi:hypothetical protein